jgi:hypothetical protein
MSMNCQSLKSALSDMQRQDFNSIVPQPERLPLLEGLINRRLVPGPRRSAHGSRWVRMARGRRNCRRLRSRVPPTVVMEALQSSATRVRCSAGKAHGWEGH